MKENLTKKLKKKKGFTLIELIIVVAIIAILAALAIPKLMGTQENAKKKADIANAKLLHDAAAKLITEDSIKATTAVSLDVSTAPATDTEAGTLYKALQTHPVPKYKSHNKFIVNISTDKDITVYVDSVSNDNQIYPQPTSATADYK